MRRDIRAVMNIIVPTQSTSEKLQSTDVPAVGPDEELIIACQKFIGLELLRQQLWGAASTIEMEEQVEKQVALTDQAFEQALSTLCDQRASTLAGLAAKARALTTSEPQYLSGMVEGSAVGGRILASMLRDLLTFQNGQVNLEHDA